MAAFALTRMAATFARVQHRLADRIVRCCWRKMAALRAYRDQTVNKLFHVHANAQSTPNVWAANVFAIQRLRVSIPELCANSYSLANLYFIIAATRCESPSSVNEPCVCLNGGTCISNSSNVVCKCPSGFDGRRCERLESCNSNNCQEPMLCQGNKCVCPEGVNCVGACSSGPCLNGATCHNTGNEYYCQCSNGYNGTNCELDIDECRTPGICGNGICVNQQGTYKCYCEPGYTGALCDLDVDECLSHPCRNNATCLNKVRHFGTTSECGKNIYFHNLFLLISRSTIINASALLDTMAKTVVMTSMNAKAIHVLRVQPARMPWPTSRVFVCLVWRVDIAKLISMNAHRSHVNTAVTAMINWADSVAIVQAPATMENCARTILTNAYQHRVKMVLSA